MLKQYFGVDCMPFILPTLLSLRLITVMVCDVLLSQLVLWTSIIAVNVTVLPESEVSVSHIRLRHLFSLQYRRITSSGSIILLILQHLFQVLLKSIKFRPKNYDEISDKRTDPFHLFEIIGLDTVDLTS
jgi:hypothetical protein